MNESPDVSVIIINWNRIDDVLRTLHYLRYQAGVRVEVVIVDDGSTDRSVERLATVEGVTFIPLKSNVGPCQARNVGIKNARGRYLFFLDSDAILSKWKLSRLVRRMDEDPTIGILACRIIDGRTRKLERWMHTQPESVADRLEFETYSFSAAGAMISARALEVAGPFWDQIFMYNEEVDLSIRVLRAGYRIVHFPEVRVYHYPAAHGRRSPGAYWRFQIRNWIWISYRYYAPLQRITKSCVYIGIYFLKATYCFQVKSYLRGVVEGLWRTDIISRFPDKLTPAEASRIGALNSRRKIRFDR